MRKWGRVRCTASARRACRCVHTTDFRPWNGVTQLQQCVYGLLHMMLATGQLDLMGYVKNVAVLEGA
jgi:hypothetical protein